MAVQDQVNAVLLDVGTYFSCRHPVTTQQFKCPTTRLWETQLALDRRYAVHLVQTRFHSNYCTVFVPEPYLVQVRCQSKRATAIKMPIMTFVIIWIKEQSQSGLMELLLDAY